MSLITYHVLKSVLGLQLQARIDVGCAAALTHSTEITRDVKNELAMFCKWESVVII